MLISQTRNPEIPEKQKQTAYIYSTIITETKIISQYAAIKDTWQQIQQLRNILCIEKHNTQQYLKTIKVVQCSLPLVLLKDLDFFTIQQDIPECSLTQIFRW